MFCNTFIGLDPADPIKNSPHPPGGTPSAGDIAFQEFNLGQMGKYLGLVSLKGKDDQLQNALPQVLAETQQVCEPHSSSILARLT